MPFHQPDSIRYYTFDSLDAHGVKHAVFTRRGGLSPQPWESLNVGGTVGDDSGRVLENRKHSFQTLGLPFESLFDVWQVHGKEVVCAQTPRTAGVPHIQADAILTAQSGVSLFMRFADCVPIFLYDPFRKVIGLVHAGWKGTLLRIVEHTVQVMRENYGSQAEDLLACIGPSIGSHHYQVGPDVARQVKDAFGANASQFLLQFSDGENNPGIQFDMWGANQLVLEQTGVRHIEICGICTACHLDDWFSHRREEGRTGRFGALIAL